jgi:Predicted membrane protein (DUF2232)
MMQIGLIGIGAGAASALLFASVTSGSWLSVILFYLAPLPVMIAGLGWSHWSALTAAFVGAGTLALIFGSYFFFAYLAGAGLPAWWLGYLALLARPVGGAPVNGGEPALEWYPPGRLVAWAAGLGAFAVGTAILYSAFDAETFRAHLHDTVSQLLGLKAGDGSAGTRVMKDIADRKRFVDFLVEAIPPAAAVLSTLTNALNLWLGARVVHFSGRLKRPWPALAAMTFPRPLAAALGISIVLSFAPGLLGILAGVAAAALLVAFGVLGFAVLHAVTQSMDARGFLLGGTYAAVLVFGWPMLVMCLIGLADMFTDMRGRIAARRGQPPAPP